MRLTKSALILTILAGLIPALFVCLSHARQLYVCKDSNGNVTISDYIPDNCIELKSIKYEEKAQTHIDKTAKEIAPKKTGKPQKEADTYERQEYSQAYRQEVLVKKIIDGDTIEVEFNGKRERVRYIGIDCPESSQEWGKEATEYNKYLLSGSRVKLEIDVQERDRYGRILAYAWSNGEMINEMLVKRGLAMMATYPPNVRYVDRFRKAQEEARLHGEGFWKDGGLKETPYQFRRHRR